MWKFRQWITYAEEEAKNSGKRLHNALAYTLGKMEPKKFVATVAHIKDS